MTKADQYRANALHEVGEDYVWGAEGSGGVSGPDDYDCSGFIWAMLHNVGVHKSRTTAEGYRRMGKRLYLGPGRVGADFGVLIGSNGQAHHIIAFVGKGETVEAKGKAYGVVRSTVRAANARGARWYRFPDVNLGNLTSAVPAPTVRPYPGVLVRTGMRGELIRWVQKRLNAHGFRCTVDGVFGPKTKAAVVAFQKAHKLAADGIVGPATWKTLAGR